MKIALLTYFTVNNTGQFFQALATLETLRRVHPAASIELVNIHHERRPAWLPPKSLPAVIPALSRHMAYASARRKSFSPALGRKCFVRPSAQEVEDYLNERKFDVVITGADTCLTVNPRREEPLPAYWIRAGVNARKFFIAASAENTVFSDLTSVQAEEAKASLMDMTGIYARDTMTQTLFGALAPERAAEVHQVGDPTFTLLLPQEASALIERRFKSAGKPVCAVNLPKSETTNAIIQELKKNYSVFSLNRASHTGEPSAFLGPWQWLAMWKSIDALVTSSFHETIFAMRSGVPFTTLDISKGRAARNGARSKASDLLTSADLQQLFWSMPPPGKAAEVAETLKVSCGFAGSEAVRAYCDRQAVGYVEAIKNIAVQSAPAAG